MADRLSSRQRRVRACAGLLIFAALASVGSIAPATLGTWLPLTCPMQRIVGLPCLFCGGTRAAHELLRGHWLAAFYYNPLAIPAVLGAIALCVMFFFEAWTGRSFSTASKLARVAESRFGFIAFLVVGGWIVQVSTAFLIPRPELINRNSVAATLWWKLRSESAPRSESPPSVSSKLSVRSPGFERGTNLAP